MQRQHRGNVHDGAGVALEELRQHSQRKARQRRDVERDHRVLRRRGCSSGRAERRRAGVVHEQRDVRVAGDEAFDAIEVGRAGEIGRDRLDRDASFTAKPVRESLEFVCPAGDEDEVIAALGKAVGINRADARGSAGYDGGAFAC